MSAAVTDINRELVEITEAHASGELDRQSFRRRRRELICQFTGETPPAQGEEEAAASVSEDDTHPKLAAVEVDDPTPAPVAPEALEGGASVTGSGSGGRLSSWKLTALLLLAAIAGLGGLLWFILG